MIDYTTTPLAGALDEPVDAIAPLVVGGGHDAAALLMSELTDPHRDAEAGRTRGK